MQLSRDVLYYWIKASFPLAKREYYHPEPGSEVHNLVFWEGAKTEGAHIVLISNDRMLHNVALPKNCIFLYLGQAEEIRGQKGDFIVLENAPAVEKVCNCVTRIFEKFDEWEKTLELSVSNYFSFQSIIRSCDYLLEDPIALTDVQFRYISYSKRLASENGFESAYVDTHNYMPMETINLVTADPDYPLLSKERAVFHHIAVDDFLHKNIFYRDGYVGRLSIPHTKDEPKNLYYSWILSVLARYIEQLYDATGTFWSAAKQNISVKELLSDLLSGAPVQMDWLQRELEALGYSPGQHYLLTQLRTDYAENREKLNRVLSLQLEDKYPGTVCLTHEDRFYILLNKEVFLTRSGLDFYQTLAVFLRESLLRAGVSRVFTDFSNLQVAARQTDGALEIGSQKDPMFWYYRFDDYAFDWLLLKGIGHYLPEHVASPAVLALREYDSRNGTELEKTLRAYLQNHFNAVNTAKALFVARSSFLKRLERIEALTKIDWDNERDLAYITLSFQLFDIFQNGE